MFLIFLLITVTHLFIFLCQFSNHHSQTNIKSNQKKILLLKKQSNTAVSLPVEKNKIEKPNNQDLEANQAQDNQESLNLYQDEIGSLIQKNYQYPLISRKLKQSGTIIATIQINANGLIEKYHFDKASDHQPLNEAFDQLMKKRVIYPLPPKELLENGSLIFKLHLRLTLAK